MDEQEIDLKELWQLLQANRKKIAKITAGFLIAAAAYLIVVPNTYQSTALLRIKDDTGLSSSIMSALPVGNVQMSTQRMNTNAEILKSRNVIMPVIEQTEEKPEGFGLWFSNFKKWVKVSLGLVKPGDESKESVYEAFIKDRIVTKPYKDTEILEVDVTGKTPEKAQEAGQLVVQGFLGRLTELSHTESGATRKFLEKRVKTSKEELNQAEDKLKDYQVAHKIFSTDNQMKSLADRLTELDKVKAQNKLDMETAQAALDTINGQLSDSGASIADSPSIQAAKTRLVELETTKAGYIGKYTDENPKMQDINRQIQGARQALDAEIQAIAAQKAPSSSTVQQKLLSDKFTNEAAISVAEGKNNAIDELEKSDADEIEKLPETQKGYIQVKRDADVAQEIYVMLAKRLEEAKVAEVMVPNEVQVVDEPTLPDKPVRPRKALTLVLALILGLLAGSGYTVIDAFMNRKIRTSQDVEQYLHLPVLGVVPELDEHKQETKKADGFLRWFRRK